MNVNELIKGSSLIGSKSDFQFYVKRFVLFWTNNESTIKTDVEHRIRIVIIKKKTKIEKLNPLEMYKTLKQKVDLFFKDKYKNVLKKSESKIQSTKKQKFESLFTIAEMLSKLIIDLAMMIYVNEIIKLLIQKPGVKRGLALSHERVRGLLFPQQLTVKSEIFDMTKIITNTTELKNMFGGFLYIFLNTQIPGFTLTWDEDRRFQIMPEMVGKKAKTNWMLRNILKFIGLSSPFTWYKKVWCKDSILKVPAHVEISLPDDTSRNKFRHWAQGLGELLLEVLDEYLDEDIEQFQVKLDFIEDKMSVYNTWRKNMNIIIENLDSDFYLNDFTWRHLTNKINELKKEKQKKKKEQSKEDTTIVQKQTLDTNIEKIDDEIKKYQRVIRKHKLDIRNKILPLLRKNPNNQLKKYLINAWKDNANRGDNNITPYDYLRLAQLLININLKHSVKEQDINFLKGETSKLNNYLNMTSKFKQYKNEQKLSDSTKSWLDLLSNVSYLPISHVLFYYWKYRQETKFKGSSLKYFITTGKKDELIRMALVMIFCCDTRNLELIYGNLEYTVNGKQYNFFDELYDDLLRSDKEKKNVTLKYNTTDYPRFNEYDDDSDKYRISNIMANYMIHNIKRYQVKVKQVHLINPDMTKREYVMKLYFLKKLINAKFVEFVGLDGLNGKDPKEQVLTKAPELSCEIQLENCKEILDLFKKGGKLPEKYMPEREMDHWYPPNFTNIDGSIFYVYKGDGIEIHVRTRQSTYLYNVMSSLTFGYFVDLTTTEGQIEDMGFITDGLTMLLSESLTKTSELTLFTSGQVKELGKYVLKFVKNYNHLKGIRELKCNISRPLNYLKKFFLQFGKRFFPKKFYDEQILYNIRISEVVTPNIKKISKPIRNYYRIHIITEMKRIIHKFFDTLSTIFVKNYKGNIYGYMTLLKLMFGPKVPLRDAKVIYMFMKLSPKKYITKMYFPYIQNQVRLFWDSVTYYEYKKTMEDYPNAIDYNFFHSFSELKLPGDNLTIPQYDIYKNSIECFFKVAKPKYGQCSTGASIKNVYAYHVIKNMYTFNSMQQMQFDIEDEKNVQNIQVQKFEMVMKKLLLKRLIKKYLENFIGNKKKKFINNKKTDKHIKKVINIFKIHNQF
jgi:hypothetical protein